MKKLSTRMATALTATIAISTLTLLPAHAQQAPAKPSAVAADKDFVKEAAQAGMAEVQAAKLALKKSQDDAVRKFAQRMVDDHTKANDKLEALAHSKNLPVPRQASKEQQKKIDSLGKVAGDTFDQRYQDFFGVPAHEKAVNLFEREAKSGADSDVRQFAQQTLPTLREHLQMARDLHAKNAEGAGQNSHGGKKPS